MSEQGSVWKQYQENIRKTEVLQHEIMRGAKEGEPLARLLDKCSLAVSLLTGSEVFHEQVLRSLRAVYADALDDPGTVEMELEATRCRLQRIEKALSEEIDADLKQEMEIAARDHQLRIARLEKKLPPAEKKQD